MKRVGILGFMHESNTFSPLRTTRQHFEQGGWTEGQDLIERWQGSHHELGGFLEGANSFGFLPIPLVAAYAVPGGAVASEAFDAMAAVMIDAIEAAMPLDGLLAALHGAAVAENFPDADGELLRRFRKTLGPRVPVVVTLDLHANVSHAMVANSTATVIYRTYPHLDQKQRGLEAAQLMARVLFDEIDPVEACEKPPLLIHLNKQYTEVPPASHLYEDLEAVLRWPGILSASVAMGFYHADVEEMGTSFLAVADRDATLARKAVCWLAQRAWENRYKFVGELPNPHEAVWRAAAAPKGLVVLMDAGDNVGGGGPGDSTILFEEILRQQVPNALVVLYDPAAVLTCVATGVRQTVELDIGAKTDQLHGRPVPVKGRVRLIADGRFEEVQVRHGAWGSYDQGLTAVLETEEAHTVVLTSLRTPPMSLEQVLSLGIKPERKKIVIAKGVVAPRAAYQAISSEIIVVDTPGSTSLDPARFDFRHRRRPLFPLENDATYPAA